MEPAVKPAAEQTKTGSIGVIATPTTFQGELFRNLVHRFGTDTRIYTQVCPGLVEVVESGKANSQKAETIVRSCIQPLLKCNIDHLVLGCTHYPFLSHTIKRIIGPRVTLVDPSPAIARQVKRVLRVNHTINSQAKSSRHILYTSSSEDSLRGFVETIVSPPLPCIRRVKWKSKCLTTSRDFV
jgi:glutamate racemase